jgi:hypothetical protein
MKPSPFCQYRREWSPADRSAAFTLVQVAFVEVVILA